MSPLAQLVETLTAAAAQRGMSLTELARRAGVARETVSRLPNRKDADFGVLQKLGDVLALDIVAVERTSPRPDLSFPYDWANCHMSSESLIAAVLDRAIFVDVLAVARHYGLALVRSISDQVIAQDPAAALRNQSIVRMLGNIQTGFSRVAV